MNCERATPELTGFHFGTTDATARAALEAHLAACPACLAAYFELKRAVETAHDEPAPSPLSRARLRRAMADELRRARGAWQWWERPLAVGLAAASVVLALNAVHAVASSPGAQPHGAAARP